MAVCYECSAELTDDNWNTSYRNSNIRICRTCYNTKFNAKNGSKRMYVNGKYIPKTHPLYKPGRYRTFNEAAFEGTYKLDSIKEGYVYIITNRAWPEWVKIGMAIDSEDRLNGYQTSSPFRDYELKHSIYSVDRRKAEQQAHTKAAKIATEVQGEWFKLPVDQAKKVLDSIEVHVTIKEEPEQVEAKVLDLFSYAESKQ